MSSKVSNEYVAEIDNRKNESKHDKIAGFAHNRQNMLWIEKTVW